MNCCKRHTFLLAFLFLIPAGVLRGQQLAFRNIGSEHGLSSTECYTVLQDSRQYIWISTDAGLCRYNGKSFKVFTTTQGLPYNTVFDLAEDRHGRIWGVCHRGGIFYLEHDSVHLIAANKQLGQSISNFKALIYSLYVDLADTLWIGSTRQMFKVPPTAGYRDLITVSAPVPCNTYLKVLDKRKILASKMLSAVTLTNERPKVELYYVENGDKSYTLKVGQGKAHTPSNESVLLPNGHLLFSYQNVLHSISPKGQISHRNFEKSINTIYQDRDGDLWIGFSDGGVMMFSKGDINQEPAHYLPVASVSSVMHDHEGGIWISTINQGIFYAPSKHFFVFHHPGLLNQRIIDLQLINDCIWSITFNNTVMRVDRNNRVMTRSMNIFNVADVGFLFPHGPSLYIGSSGGYTLKTDSSFSRYKNIRSAKAPVVFIGMQEDRDHTLWGITSEELMRIENDSVKAAYRFPSRISSFFIDKKGEFWIGCQDGLYTFSGGHYRSLAGEYPGLGTRISGISQDPSGNLCVSTRASGIYIRSAGRWFNYNISHGLPSDNCNHIFADKDGSYWVSSNKGLSHVIPLPGKGQVKIENYNSRSGLLSDEVEKVARRGEYLWLATRRGICMIHTGRQLYNTVGPQVNLVSFSINEKAYAPGQLPGYFSYNQNNLRVKADVTTFKSSLESPVLSYQLLPVDPLPFFTSQPELNYNSLSPGHYTLVLKGLNNNMVAGAEVRIPFTIRKPFWLTFWFIGLAAFVFIGVTYIIIRIRVTASHRQQEEKYRTRQQLTEYQFMTLQAQMNPHFIFNAINSIQLYILDNQPKEAYDYLTKFSKLIRLVLSHSRERSISLHQELETLKLYIELEQMRFENAFSFRLELDDKIDTNQVIIPSMLIQPVVENAIWHGLMPLDPGIRAGELVIRITGNKEELKIIIQDNGVGRNARESQKKKPGYQSAGLKLIEQRLKLISQRSQTSIADLSENGAATGTIVTLSIPMNKEAT